MPLCSILNCRNDSNKTNITNGDITYHNFPNQLEFREVWVASTGRINWTPTKTSRLCSIHFEDKYFICRGKVRKLCPNAVPTLNVLSFHRQMQVVNFEKVNESYDVSGILQDHGISEQNVSVSVLVPKKQIGEEKDYRMAVLNERKLEGILDWTRRKINMSNKRLKKYKDQIRWLKQKHEKIQHLQYLLTHAIVTAEKFKINKGTQTATVLYTKCHNDQGDTQVFYSKCDKDQNDTQVIYKKCDKGQDDIQMIDITCDKDLDDTQVIYTKCRKDQDDIQMIDTKCDKDQKDTQVIYTTCDKDLDDTQVIHTKCDKHQDDTQVIYTKCGKDQDDIQMIDTKCVKDQKEIQVIYTTCAKDLDDTQVIYTKCDKDQDDTQVIYTKCDNQDTEMSTL